jgi:hypothetical protein
MLIFALALSASTSLTDVHQRDIACVAVMAVIAGEQQRGVTGSDVFPDVRETGKRWMPIVGERVMRETGQPRELVGLAMTESAKAAQARTQVKECAQRMAEDLVATDIAEGRFDAVQWDTDDGVPQASMQQRIVTDAGSSATKNRCHAVLSSAPQTDKMTAQLAAIIRQNVPLPEPGLPLQADLLDGDKADMFLRCMQLAQYLGRDILVTKGK